MFASLCHFLVAVLALSDCFEFNLQVRCLFLASTFAVPMAADSAVGRKEGSQPLAELGPEAVHSCLNCCCSTA